MKITGTYMGLRVYFDEFSVNNPLGSAANSNKILGIYVSGFNDLKIASRRDTIQTIALISSKGQLMPDNYFSNIIMKIELKLNFAHYSEKPLYLILYITR